MRRLALGVVLVVVWLLLWDAPTWGQPRPASRSPPSC